MAFACYINFNLSTIPLSSTILFDERGITVIGTTEKTIFDKIQNIIFVGIGTLANKKNLINTLRLPSDATLGQIIINGYLRQGESFFTHLDGRFSFCILDIATNSLIGVRDQFGSHSLYFQYYSDKFLISNDIYEIIKEIPASINTNAIVNYFDFAQNNKPCGSETFFQGIQRVLPGYYVYFKDKLLSKQKPYWQPSLEKYKHLSVLEKAEIFQEKLIEAVRKNSVSTDNICTNLSGGLDSSSISCISKRLEKSPSTIYFSTGHTSTNERHFADEAVRHYGFPLYEVYPVQNPLLTTKKFIEIYKMPDELFMPVSSFFSIREQVQKLDSKCILTGDGGDSIVAYGNEYFQELYEQQKWSILNKSFRLYVENRDLSFYFENWEELNTKKRTQIYSTYFHSNIIFNHLKSWKIKKVFKALKIANQHFSFNNFTLVGGILKSILGKIIPQPTNNTQLLKNHLRVDTTTHKNQHFDLGNLVKSFTESQKEHFGYSFTKMNLAVIEQQNAIMREAGIEAIHPFLDKELIEISVAISAEFRFYEGLGRGPIRQAMKGILPEAIRLRTTKVEFSEYLLSYFERLWEKAKNEIQPDHAVWSYVKKNAFDEIIKHIFDPKISHQKKTMYVWLANRTINLALWLDFFYQQSKNIKEDAQR